MKLWSETFRDGGLMPAENAFAEIDPASRVRLAGNRNPHLAWDEVPNGTESLALFCIDPDAPQDASLANVEGQALPLTALASFWMSAWAPVSPWNPASKKPRYFFSCSGVSRCGSTVTSTTRSLSLASAGSMPCSWRSCARVAGQMSGQKV